MTRGHRPGRYRRTSPWTFLRLWGDARAIGRGTMPQRYVRRVGNRQVFSFVRWLFK